MPNLIMTLTLNKNRAYGVDANVQMDCGEILEVMADGKCFTGEICLPDTMSVTKLEEIVSLARAAQRINNGDIKIVIEETKTKRRKK